MTPRIVENNKNLYYLKGNTINKIIIDLNNKKGDKYKINPILHRSSEFGGEGGRWLGETSRRPEG